MGRQEREWRLIREESLCGARAMALDEVAAATCASGGPRTVRVYQWDPSALSLGYRQAAETVDWSYCEREGIDVVRRPTGGGGIYHDRIGDISYSIIAPAEELPSDLLESYERLLEPIFSWFESLGIDAAFTSEERPAMFGPACYLREMHPAHDIVVNGMKISGNAQYRQREAIIQHGSVTFEAKPARHLGVFSESGISASEFRRRVTSITEQASVSRDDAVRGLEAVLQAWSTATDGAWTAKEQEHATELVESKYSTDDWTYRL